MESLIHHLFFHQWQRKLVALLTATIIWFFVNHSITSTKTIAGVPIRVINLPTDKTIQGLLPNGFLTKRVTLTLSGTKGVVDQLEPGDIEVILDVANLPTESIIQINKKNLISLNPSFNLPNNITSVSHPEFVLKMSPVHTDKIPISIQTVGEPPEGYDFLDIWPPSLYYMLSGPEDQVLALKKEGLELTFDLNQIQKEQLDSLKGNGLSDDEVSYYVPEEWKKIKIPSLVRGSVMINDPEVRTLHLTFLRQQLIPLKNEIPLHVFYSLDYSDTINPKTYALESSSYLKFKNDIPILTLPLLVGNVSKLFTEIVKNNLEIDIVTALPSEREELEWDVGFINEYHLEDMYVAFLLSNQRAINSNNDLQNKSKEREQYYRKRFRKYMQRYTLYVSPQHKLRIESRLENGKILVRIPNASLQPSSQ